MCGVKLKMSNTNTVALKTEVRTLWSREKLQQQDISYFLNYGNSMKPLIREGDLAETRRTTYKQLRIGDIILAKTAHLSSGLIMHRIIGKHRQNGHAYLVTQGDAARYPDPPIYVEDILGKVISIKHDRKTIRLDRGLYYGLGRFLGHFAFLVRWINRSGLRKYIGSILRYLFCFI